MSEENFLLRMFEAVLANEIAKSFSLVLLAIFAWALVRYFRPAASGEAVFVRAAPTAMTSIGILGTFTGIFIGLLDFDVQDIDASVPALLEGLKIAFITSIVGISLAVVFKLIQSLWPATTAPSGVTADEIYQTLTEIRDDAREFQDDSNEAFGKLRSSIAGEGETSLVTQLQKLRTSVSDGNSELLKEFREFAETMAENNSKALIQALEEVMRDFNAKINEQFGDNFKRLNEAVGALLTWQENYRHQVEEMTAQLNRSIEAIEAVRSSISEIASHAKAIPDTMDKLAELLPLLRHEVEHLGRHLEAFQHLRSPVGEAFPVIEQSLKTISEDVNAAVRQHSTDIRETVAEMRSSFENAITSSNDVIQRQIQELDSRMQDELSRAIERMGGHLASLSNKFVDDYTPLTDKLRRVVELAERQ